MNSLHSVTKNGAPLGDSNVRSQQQSKRAICPGLPAVCSPARAKAAACRLQPSVRPGGAHHLQVQRLQSGPRLPKARHVYRPRRTRG